MIFCSILFHLCVFFVNYTLLQMTVAYFLSNSFFQIFNFLAISIKISISVLLQRFYTFQNSNMPFNLSYYIRPVILRKQCLQIIALGKALIIYIQSNNMSLDYSFKKIVIGMEILNLYTYFFSKNHIVKLLKQIVN